MLVWKSGMWSDTTNLIKEKVRPILMNQFSGPFNIADNTANMSMKQKRHTAEKKKILLE